MNKKVQSIALTAIVAANSIGSAGTVFANEVSKITGRLTHENGTGGSQTNPFVVRVGSVEDLNKVLDHISDTNNFRTHYRLKDIIENTTDNTKTYQLHLFNSLVTYLNIRVESGVDTTRLDNIRIFGAYDTGEGNGTKSNPRKIELYAEGVTKLINGLRDEGYSELYRTGKITEENGNRTYEMCAIASPSDEETSYSNKNNEMIYMDVVVESDNLDTIMDLEDSISIAPEIETPANEWKTFNTLASLKANWTVDESEDGKVILQKYNSGSKNPMIEIPRVVGGKKVEISELKSSVFPNVTHIRVAEGSDDNKVKLRSNSLSYAFHGNDTLEYVDFSGIYTPNLTNLYSAFFRCNNLKEVNLKGWNVTGITGQDAQHIFGEARKLKTINLSGWDFPNISLSGAFSKTDSLENLIFRDMPNKNSLSRLLSEVKASTSKNRTVDVSNLNLNGINSLKELFVDDGIVEIKGLDTWNTSNIRDFSWLFKNCRALERIDVSTWDTTGAKWMSNIFNGCNKLRFIDLSNWEIPESVSENDIANMFRVDNNLTEEERKLLVVTDDQRLTKYKYESNNRTKVQTIFDAEDGEFHRAGGDKITRMIKERFTITPDIANDIAGEMESARQFAGTPVRDGYIFGDWITDKNLVGASIFDILDTTFTPEWGTVIADPETGGEAVGDAPIHILDGKGSSTNPFALKINNEEGLKQVFNVLNDKDKYTNYYRLKDTKNDGNTITYELHLFDNANQVTYLNIIVDSNKSDLISKLDKINVLVSDVPEVDNTTTSSTIKVSEKEEIENILNEIKVNSMEISKYTRNLIKDGGSEYIEYVLTITKNNKTRNIDNHVLTIKIDKSNEEAIAVLDRAIKYNGDTQSPTPPTGGGSISGGSSIVIPETSNKVETQILAGQDRYETAIKVSQERFKDGKANAVVLVGKDAIVDGLAAAPLANSKNAPILFADTNTITSETKQEILRVLGNNLSGKTIYIVGGEARISKSVESMLAQMGVKVERLAGEDRFETSLEVAKHLNGNSNIAFVVGGNGEADAMSISSKAAELKAPIVVVDKNNLSEESKDLLKGKEIHVIGGTNVVSEKVETELDKLDSNKDSDRVAGSDRKETNAKVISTFYKSEDISELFIAKDGYVGGNDKLVDALAAAPLAGANSTPIILTTDGLNEFQKENIKGLDKVSKVVQVGYGISKDVVNSIVELLKK